MTTSLKLLRNAAGHAWVGETFQDATHVAAFPEADDPRWIPGIPTQQDTEFVTLSPFFPSGRLGVAVEISRSNMPKFGGPNHPPFFGCKAWMQVDALHWHPVTPGYPITKQPVIDRELEERLGVFSVGDTVSVKGWDGQWVIAAFVLSENGESRNKPVHLRSVARNFERPAVNDWQQHIWIWAAENELQLG